MGLRVLNFRRMAVVHVVADHDAADRNISLQRSSNTNEHYDIEAPEFRRSCGGYEAGVAVPLGREGMHDMPLPSRVQKASIFEEIAFFTDQHLWFEEMGLNRVGLAEHGRENQCPPGLGSEFFFDLRWGAVRHFYLRG